MKFFNTDGPLYRFMNQFKDLLVFNFIWILFSLPIVTIGASSVAACAVGMKIAKNEEGYIARSFVKEFKKNWKQGTAVWLMMVLLGYALYLDFQILHVQANPSVLVIIASIAAVVVFFLSFTYAFALLARYDNTVLHTIQNSYHIALHYFGRTIAMIVTLAFILLILCFNRTMLYFMIVIGPGALFYTYSSFCLQVFQKVEDDNPGSTRDVRSERK